MSVVKQPVECDMTVPGSFEKSTKSRNFPGQKNSY